MRCDRRDQRGLSLIETLAAITIFALITLGILPLLTSSIRGTALSRSYTVGKDLALEAMERARGLPFYVAFQAQQKKVDVLDLYIPCADPTLASTGCAGEGTRLYDPATGTFSITCATADTGPTCALPLAPGYSLRYDARFVRENGTTGEPPPSTYKRNPSTTEGALDTPPTSLLELKITSLWTVRGTARNFTLQSLLGDRKFGNVKMSAVGKINFSVQALTSFQHTLGDARTSDLRAIAGQAESRLESRLVSNADQRVRAAEISLVRRATDTDPNSAALTPGGVPILGAVAEFRAPPNQVPAPVSSPDVNSSVTLTHPNLAINNEVAHLKTTSTSGVSVKVVTELPEAAGGFTFGGALSPTGFFWVNNQTDAAQNALLKLDLTRKVFSLKRENEAIIPVTGETNVSSAALGGGRFVRARANTFVNMIRAMPVSYLFGAEDERHIVLIKNFTASVDCNSVGTAASTQVGDWSASVKVWWDPVNDGVIDIRTKFLTINSATAAGGRTTLGAVLEADFDPSDPTNGGRVSLKTDPAAAPAATSNPLIYDGVLPTDDVYLFNEPLKNGYLTSFTLKQLVTSEGAGGDLGTASVDGAIQLATVPTNPLLPESGLNVAVGSLSCEALDAR